MADAHLFAKNVAIPTKSYKNRFSKGHESGYVVRRILTTFQLCRNSKSGQLSLKNIS